MYAVGDKLKSLLKIKSDQFGFYQIPTCQEQAEEEGADKQNGEEAKEKEAAGKKDFADDKHAKKVWISRCKGPNAFVVYGLFESTKTGALELYSIGKNQGGGLLGLGESKQEAKWF